MDIYLFVCLLKWHTVEEQNGNTSAGAILTAAFFCILLPLWTSVRIGV